MRWTVTGAIATAGVFCGAAVAYWIVYTASGVFAPGSPNGVASGIDIRGDEEDEPAAEAAMRYAEALRARDCEAVIAQTAWMQDRLERVRLTGGHEAEAAERTELADRIVAWHEEENVLEYEGVKDAYVFAPGCSLALSRPSVEEERVPAKADGIEMVWLRVTYPHKQRALRDASGRPLKALTAGVAIDGNGQVVKAALRGNLEIARSSLEYFWPEQKE